MIKKIAKQLVVRKLSRQVAQLYAAHKFKVVAVSGSIGKTSTKTAIAQLLSEQYRVRFQEGNYNDLVTVPLVFFNEPLPSLTNPLAWWQVFRRNQKQIDGEYPVDVVVLELGTDGPGQIGEFRKFLKVDIGVVTAIAPEHMEFFENLDAVAFEELAIGGFSEKLVLNSDLCAPKYRNEVTATTYGIHEDAFYKCDSLTRQGSELAFEVRKRTQEWLHASHKAISEVQIYSLLAAMVVADEFGMTKDEILAGISRVVPVSGRMQLLDGIQETIIIDDTYNASPEAVKAALDTLYSMKAPQRIALLGNMNELGEYSEQAHKEIGQYCDPSKLDLVVTLAGDANTFTAAEAEAKGCTVIRTDSPYDAGEKIKAIMKPGAVILAKGSQNRVFAEEALKVLLANPTDATKLVRQSAHWMGVKQVQFSPEAPAEPADHTVRA